MINNHILIGEINCKGFSCKMLGFKKSAAGNDLNDGCARSHLKNRILIQGQGGTEIQPAGILQYSEELKRGPNTEIGTKDFFEIASKKSGLK